MEYLGNGRYRLSSGKEFAPSYGGVIGIDADLDMHSGYDGTLSEDVQLTPMETHELAVYMSSLWEQAARKAFAEIGKELDTP